MTFYNSDTWSNMPVWTEHGYSIAPREASFPLSNVTVLVLRLESLDDSAPLKKHGIKHHQTVLAPPENPWFFASNTI